MRRRDTGRKGGVGEGKRSGGKYRERGRKKRRRRRITKKKMNMRNYGEEIEK